MPYPGFKNKRTEEAPAASSTSGRTSPASGKTENFFTNHVKLLTFLITSFLLIAAMVGWTVWVNWKYDPPEPENLMSESEMQALVKKGNTLTWEDFAPYASEVLVNEQRGYICSYDVKGGRYCFWVASEYEGSPITSVLWYEVAKGTQTEIFAPEVEPENLMTESEMQTLVEKGSALTWEDFEPYAVVNLINEQRGYICSYDVKGKQYYFLVTSEYEGGPITSVVLVKTTTNQRTEIFAPEDESESEEP